LSNAPEAENASAAAATQTSLLGVLPLVWKGVHVIRSFVVTNLVPAAPSSINLNECHVLVDLTVAGAQASERLCKFEVAF